MFSLNSEDLYQKHLTNFARFREKSIKVCTENEKSHRKNCGIHRKIFGNAKNVDISANICIFFILSTLLNISRSMENYCCSLDQLSNADEHDKWFSQLTNLPDKNTSISLQYESSCCVRFLRLGFLHLSPGFFGLRCRDFLARDVHKKVRSRKFSLSK